MVAAVRGESATDTLGRLVAIGAAHTHVLVSGTVGPASAAVRCIWVGEGLDDSGQFGLQRVDALLNDSVGLEVTRAFDVDVERRGLGVVVVWLIGGSGSFPFAVFGDRPFKFPSASYCYKETGRRGGN